MRRRSIRVESPLFEVYRNDIGRLLSDMRKANEMDAAADYVARGRGLRTLGVEALTEKFVLAANGLAESYFTPEAQRSFTDAEAEFRLRRKRPPYERVRKQFTDIDEILHMMALKSQDDPSLRAAIDELIRLSQAVFFDRVLDRKSKN